MGKHNQNPCFRPQELSACIGQGTARACGAPSMRHTSSLFACFGGLSPTSLIDNWTLLLTRVYVQADAIGSSSSHQHTAAQQPAAATALQPDTLSVELTCDSKPTAAYSTELQAAGGVGHGRKQGHQQQQEQHHTAAPHSLGTALQDPSSAKEQGLTQADALVDIQPVDDHKTWDMVSSSNGGSSTVGSGGLVLGQPADADAAAALPGHHQRQSLLRLSLLLGITMVGVTPGCSV